MYLLDILHMSKFHRFLILIMAKMSNESAYFDVGIICYKERERSVHIHQRERRLLQTL